MNLEIAQRLQQLRKAHGYSQEGLAEKLGLSRQAVSKWERAESSPDTDNLIELARLYDVSIDELLLGKAGEPELPTPEPEETGESAAGEEAELEAEAVEPIQGFAVTDYCEQTGKRGIRWHAFPYPIFAVLVFFIWGFLGGWYISWTVFLTIPLYYTLVDAIRKRNPHHFAWPVFVTFVYCVCGMQWGLWHPLWMLFLTIPLYYSICSMFR